MPDLTLVEWTAVVQAATAVGALIAAVYAGIVARRLLRNDDEREEDRARAQLQSQAELVSAWVAESSTSYLIHRSDTKGQIRRHSVFIQNASKAPIRFTRATIFVNEKEISGGDITRPVIPPSGEEPREFPLNDPIVMKMYDAADHLIFERVGDTFSVELWFWDNAGRAWSHKRDGRLVLEHATRAEGLSRTSAGRSPEDPDALKQPKWLHRFWRRS